MITKLKFIEPEVKRRCTDLPGKGKQNRFCRWTGGRKGWEHKESRGGEGVGIEEEDVKRDGLN